MNLSDIKLSDERNLYEFLDFILEKAYNEGVACRYDSNISEKYQESNIKKQFEDWKLSNKG